jgi:hypothetical protein
MIRLKKMDLKAEKWIFHNLIGEGLKGKLIEQVTPTFCPKEVQEAIDPRVEYIYNLGFDNALQQIRDSLLVVEYDGDK